MGAGARIFEEVEVDALFGERGWWLGCHFGLIFARNCLCWFQIIAKNSNCELGIVGFQLSFGTVSSGVFLSYFASNWNTRGRDLLPPERNTIPYHEMTFSKWTAYSSFSTTEQWWGLSIVGKLYGWDSVGKLPMERLPAICKPQNIKIFMHT